MSKMSELSMLLDEVTSCCNALAAAASALKDFCQEASEKQTTEVPKSKPAEKPKEAEPAAMDPTPAAPDPVQTTAKEYSKEEVRALLSRKANEDGGSYKAQVRAIVRKYGNGGTLTDVDPADYAALVAEMEALGNAG